MPKQSQPQTPEEEGEERVNFSARVRVSVRRRARLYAAEHDVNLQDLVDAALDDYLTRHNA
ncbi:hypothetical protein ACFOSC_27945 [Streptantibioticus rubrisoli]|uniref:Uncharacterized protein n=1 Tax=Streptantibioticus rubrisoli TaxID=1387313 RepID=A0ABT1PKC6_9ACTN|nr:hypothetical protein [Streptantibioticus rubrisoli]MCQ4045815.1 hypothetical protein [Streptantibioticus rubrisoli]